MKRTGVGFFWLIPAALVPLATNVVIVGNIAAVAAGLTDILAKIDPNSDFAKAMRDIRDIANIVKFPSIFAAGIGGLMEYGIPSGFQAAAARWYELARSPIEAVGGPSAAAKLPEVSRALASVERSLATHLPSHIATLQAPVLLEGFAKGSGPVLHGVFPTTSLELALKNLVDANQRDLLERWKRDKSILPPDFDENKVKAFAAQQAHAAVRAAISAPPPPPFEVAPGQKGSRVTKLLTDVAREKQRLLAASSQYTSVVTPAAARAALVTAVRDLQKKHNIRA